MSLNQNVFAIGVMAMSIAGCGGAASPADKATHGALQPNPSCLSASSCASSALDCSQGQRCNTALTPPRCENLYCGADGSLCADDQWDAENLCQSHFCSPAGVCAAFPADMASGPDLARPADLNMCGAKGVACRGDSSCCSGTCGKGNVCCNDINLPCASASDCCGEGESCFQGTCSQIMCVELGQICQHVGFCCEGYCDGTCVQCIAQGRPCTANAQCCTNYCDGVSCQPPQCLFQGQPCTANAQCCSNSCSAGSCTAP